MPAIDFIRKPRPWSFSSLSTFTTCPRRYFEEQIAKSVPKEETEAQLAGTRAHSAFEFRLKDKTPLPADLAGHEPLMKEIEAGPGEIQTELKYGLNRRLEPVGFYAPDVWHRGIIDVRKRRPDGSSLIVDYKTGRPKNEMRQLHLFSAYCFLDGDGVVESYYYWTKTKVKNANGTPIKMPKQQLGPIMASLVPDLTAYVQAFRDDIWPPKRNHFCKNYCGVVGCEFHGKGMNER